ncbi:MAG TPA: DUF1592 domain-containing protein [Polyangiaceae bacterium]|nr:DUF1592 domain-containing protein [Polyangiaceae bacterium]
MSFLHWGCSGGAETDPAAAMGGANGSGGQDSAGDAAGTAGSAGALSQGPIDVTTLAECAQRTLPAQPLRRLSSAQYHNTLRDLFGPELASALLEDSLFPETRISAGFSGDAEANTVNTQESNAIEDNAERIAELIIAAPEPYLGLFEPCTVSAADADAEIDGCVDAFIQDFGRRAYRRPATATEIALARRVYDEVRGEESALVAWASVVQYFVQAPALLYRVEHGAGPSAIPGLVQLSSHEMATRLSYLLSNSIPDQELARAADADELTAPDNILAQVDRLLASDAFLPVATAFHREWLKVYEVPTAKDGVLFPAYTPEVHASLELETQEFLRHVLTSPEPTLQAVLSSSTYMVNAPLAAFYGAAAPDATADTWVPVEFNERRGLFTSASLMTTLALETRTHPIHRGGFFRTQVLCQTLPALPGNIDIQGPLLDTSMEPTARGRLAPLTTRGDCSPCHMQINPLGLAFENYDAVGQYRSQENGVTIDASSSFVLDGTERSFGGPTDLVEALAQSTQVRDCYSLQWYRAANGRPDLPEDACGVATVRQVAAQAQGDLRQIVRAVAQTDAFLYRPEVSP